MGDRDSKHVFDDNWQDDKSRLLARKASAKKSNLLRDAINAVDAALGADRRNKRQLEEVTSSEELLQIQDMQQVRAIEPRTSQEIIEQALIEMKTHSDADFVAQPSSEDNSGQKKQGELQPYPQDNSHHHSPETGEDSRLPEDTGHPLQGKLDPGRTQRVRMPSRGPSPSFYQEPVVAWLVIVQGPGLGSFRPVYEGNNTIGRAAGQHIQLDFGDDTISSEEQAFIRYDPQERSYLFIPNLAKTNVVSLNEDKPTSAVELKAMDIITMGQTRMAFVPFCGEEFDWSDIV